MVQAEQVIAIVKRTLAGRGISYRQLARELGLSESSVKRIFSRNTFTLERLLEICAHLDLSLVELARLSEGAGADETLQELTDAQETALAADPRLLALLYLLLRRWTVTAIQKDLKLDNLELQRLLSALDRLALIELHPGGKVRMRVSRGFSWRRGGPLRREHEDRAISEFLGQEFAGQEEARSFLFGELSSSSRRRLLQRLAGLQKEFTDLAEVDAALPKTQTAGCGLHLAFRPWVYSVITRLKTR